MRTFPTRSSGARTLFVVAALTLAPFSASSVAQEPVLPTVAGRVVAIFADGIPRELGAVLGDLAIVRGVGPEIGLASLQAAPGAEATVLGVLRSRSDVVAAYRPPVLATQFVPDDELYPWQWGPRAIGLEAAWEAGLGSHAVKVAIVDSGIDYANPELRPHTFLEDPACGPDHDYTKKVPTPGPTWEGYRWSPLPAAQDDVGHGTHVAGIVGATVNNAAGTAGTGNFCLLSVKSFHAELGGQPFRGVGFADDVALGILHATRNGARVLSMSFGGQFDDLAIRGAIQHAASRGIVLVASAGNSFCPSSVSYPAAYPEVISVAALEAPDRVASFSRCGADVEIAAPGARVLSTVLPWDFNRPDTCLPVQCGHAEKSGTSMAAPFVSGVAALVLAANPGLDSQAVRCILAATADDLGAPGRDPSFGFGRLDAAQAVAFAFDPVAVGC